MPITRRQTLAGVSAGGSLLLASCSEFDVGIAMDRDVIDVRAPKGESRGSLQFGALQFPCMVGRSGIVAVKHEGDRGTPAGLFKLREVRYRPDKFAAPPETRLPRFPAQPNDGWCDDPSDPAYNKLVTLPYQSDAETMWRKDGLYDVLAVIGYNDAPVVPGAGSAIFMHVAREDAAGTLLPTVGCVSARIENVLAVLANCTPATSIRIRTL